MMEGTDQSRRSFLRGLGVLAMTGVAMAAGVPAAQAKEQAAQAVDTVFENRVHLRMTQGSRTLDCVGDLTRASIEIRHDWHRNVMDIGGVLYHRPDSFETGEVTITFPLEDVKLTYTEAKR